MVLGLGIGMGVMAPISVVAAPAGEGIAAIAPFTRDRVVFDTGAAVGSNSVTVPLPAITTDADDGTTIEVRAVRADTGAQVYGWRGIGTATGGGLSGATLIEPTGARSPHWLRIEVRVAGSAAAPGQMSSTFAAGHVIDLWGQSELHRAVLSNFAFGGTRPAVADDDALQVSYCDATGANWGNPANFRHQFIAQADSGTGHLIGLSNLFAAERPGEKFHVVFQTLSGTGVRNLLAGENPEGRLWASDMALRAFALADGQETGLAIQSWYNADAGALNTGYGAFWARAISGLEADGVTPSTLAHNFSDIYDYSRTRFAIAGPHRFEGVAFDASIPQIRASLRSAFASDARMTDRAIRVVEPLSYLNGDAGGGDVSHPRTQSLDGYDRLFVQLGQGMLQGLGFGYPTPEFDNATLAPDQTYVEVWSSVGDVLTARTHRGETRPAGFPAIYGFRWNGTTPAVRADIVAGRVRVYWNAGGDPIPDGSVLSFGSNGIGTETLPDDLTPNAVWQDHPLVDQGQSGIEGLPVRGLTPAAVLDVVPAAAEPAEGNPNPNLVAGTRFNLGLALASGLGGWTDPNASGAWTFNGDGTITSDATANRLARGSVEFAGVELRDGTPKDLAFYLTGDGTGDIGYQISLQGGGGGTSIVAGTLTAPPMNAEIVIPMGVLPNSNARLQIEFRRLAGATGSLIFRRFTIKTR